MLCGACFFAFGGQWCYDKVFLCIPMPTAQDLTVISYNIHKGLSPLNRRVVLSGILDALSAHSPDVVCLQEVQGQHSKRVVKFANFPNQSQSVWLGSRLAMDECYGKNCQYPKGHHGNAILSCHPFITKTNLDLTVNRLEKRGLLHANIMHNNTPIAILCCHLNLLHKDRIKQYQAIVRYVDNHIDPNQPLILAGDFNDWTKQADKWLASLQLTEVFKNNTGDFAKTFPAKLPLLSLDRLYVRHLTIKKTIKFYHQDWQQLSDHLPLGAVLTL